MFLVLMMIGIVEGIEIVFFCYQVYGVNIWVVINSGFMKKFWVLVGVKYLIIFVDMDKYFVIGYVVVFECVYVNLLVKNDLVKVSICWLDNGDFNDMFMNGDQVCE